jgi:hypothetical protein
MKRQEKVTKLAVIAAFALLLTAAPAAFAGVSVGIGFNVGFAPPVPAAPEVVVASLGPGFVWVAGHNDWVPGFGYRWVGGGWARPPYPHAVWVGPRYYHGPRGRIFYRGYWRR